MDNTSAVVLQSTATSILEPSPTADRRHCGLIISRSNREVAYLLAGLVVFVALVSGAVLLAVPVEGAPARFPRLRRALDWPAPE